MSSTDPATATIPLHGIVVADPLLHSIPNMVAAARRVFEPRGIAVDYSGLTRVTSDDFLDVDAGTCQFDVITDDQRQLFTIRHAEGAIHAYFVRSTVPAYYGCAAHESDRPSFLVAGGASVWTLAHELGHLLGRLEHVKRRDQLMYGGGTDRINSDPPGLSPAEVQSILSSPYLIVTGGP